MILKVVSLVLATVCVLIYVICSLKAAEYDVMVDNLDEKEYPLKDIYSVGYVMGNMPLFRLRGKVKEKLIKYSKLLYPDVYVNYYVELAWAQFLSFSVFFSGIIFVFSSVMTGTSVLMFMTLAVLAIAAFWNMFISRMKDAVKKRSDVCAMEFPDMISKLSLLISTGMVLREAWSTVAYGKDGELYLLMRRMCEDMNNGMSDMDAMFRFGVLSDSNDIKKFTGLIIQELEKGSGNLDAVLINQSKELWAHKRQMMLQKGETAAGQLIIPLGITFGGIILIILVAAMGNMQM